MITVGRLVHLLESYRYCPLECDGLTKIFTSLLTYQNIDHTVYTGRVSHQKTGRSLVHMWIELETDWGWRIIDYRARLWLGVGGEVPDGIFDPRFYPDVIYEGTPSKISLLTEEAIELVGAPITGLIKALAVLPQPLVFTVGYRQPHAGAVLDFLTSRGFPIADIRDRAGSRYDPAYNLNQLKERFPVHYVRVRELGNLDHALQGLCVRFRDLQVGLMKSQQLLEDTAGQGLIYLCACQDWRECHRSKAAHHLLDVVPELTVAHVQANGSLIVERRNSRGELLMISTDPIGPHGMFRIIFDDNRIASTYNPASAESFLRDAEAHPERVQVRQCYCEVPVHDYTRQNLEWQGYLVAPSDTTIAEAPIPASAREEETDLLYRGEHNDC